MLNLTGWNDKGELWKLIFANGVGVGLILVLMVVAYWITPVGDPTILSWLVVKKIIVMILAILGTLDAASLIDFVTHGNWWHALIEDENYAVALACAGLWIGIGLAISGSV